MSKKLIIIFGTRPEAIKMAPVVLASKQHGTNIETRVAVSSQHREMLYQALDVFGIVPDVDLDIMVHNQTLYGITIRTLAKLEAFFDKERPDMILVQGDTTTAFAASLAAFYEKIPVGHVEAGLRTGDRLNPFPEEMNRRLIDQLSTLLFAPTERAKQNLLNEGADDSKIFVTGNTIVDAFTIIKSRIDQGGAALQKEVVDLTSDGSSGLILVTTHRRESFGTPLRNICLAVKRIAQHFPKKTVLFPVHMNPAVREPVNLMLRGIKNVRLINPVDYVNFVYLMSEAELILTDSGGIQEEVTCLNKRAYVLRECTERTEAEATGLVEVIGTNADTIFMNVCKSLESTADSPPRVRGISPYGDGRAAERIVQLALQHLRVM